VNIYCDYCKRTHIRQIIKSLNYYQFEKKISKGNHINQ